MPHVTCLRKKKEAMEPYPTSSLASAPLDLMTPISTCNPPPSTPKKPGPSPQDIEAFMNQLENVTLVNAIIDKNINTIMENFQKDKIEKPDYENPTPLLDPSHPFLESFHHQLGLMILIILFIYLMRKINQLCLRP